MQLFAEAAEPTIVMQQQSSAITLNLPIMASESSILDLNNTSISKSLSVIENVHNKVFSDLHRSLEDMQDPEDGLLGTRFDLALEDAFKTVRGQAGIYFSFMVC